MLHAGERDDHVPGLHLGVPVHGEDLITADDGDQDTVQGKREVGHTLAAHRASLLGSSISTIAMLPLRSDASVRMSPMSTSSSIIRVMMVVEDIASIPSAWKMCSFLGLFTRATARGTPKATLASWQATRLSSSSPVTAAKTSARATPASSWNASSQPSPWMMRAPAGSSAASFSATSSRFSITATSCLLRMRVVAR